MRPYELQMKDEEKAAEEKLRAEIEEARKNFPLISEKTITRALRKIEEHPTLSFIEALQLVGVRV